MKEKRHRISATDYVLRLPQKYAAATASRKLRSIGGMESLPGYSDLYVVHLAKPATDPRRGWQRIREALGGNVEVTPVFLDDDHAPRYAAGTLQVRFPSPLTDAALRQWLPRGLRLKYRNEYVEAQVALELENPTEQYLPDLLAALEKQSDQNIKIWPETLQQFRRA